MQRVAWEAKRMSRGIELIEGVKQDERNLGRSRTSLFIGTDLFLRASYCGWSMLAIDG